MKRTIEVKNYTKSYGDKKAVDQVSFTIEEGSITGFIGKNGAGKTTTIRAMMNFIKPDEGNITIAGFDVIKEAVKVHELVGYMPGDCTFYPSLIGLDVLKMYASIANVEMSELQKLATYFELDLSKKTSQLSLGNRKKLSIIQALAQPKEIFILDEPTNGLDPYMQKKFFDLLISYKQEGKTIFLSSHNLADVEKYCDRALIIRDGKLLEDVALKDRKKLGYYILYQTMDDKYHTITSKKAIHEILAELQQLELQDIEIRKATIEDEFIKYFKEDE